MKETLFVILMIISILLAIVVLPNVLIKRAMHRVIKIFREQNALSPRKAKSVRELKLEPRSFLMSMVVPRDYKPRALQYLRRANIVRSTEDGRLYLSEETLRQFDIEKRRR